MADKMRVVYFFVSTRERLNEDVILFSSYGFEVFFQKSRQVAAGKVGDCAEFQVQHVVIRPIALDPRFQAQIGDLSQGKAAFGADEVQINGVEFFGLHRGPGFFLLGDVDRHDLFIVPKDLGFGGRGRQKVD